MLNRVFVPQTWGKVVAQRTVRFYLIADENQRPFGGAFPFDDVKTAIRHLADDEAYVQLGAMEVLGSPFDPPTMLGARREVPLIALDVLPRDVD